MNITIDSRRKQTIKWMITLPDGENDKVLEMAIKNAISEGKNLKQVIEFITVSFHKEIDEFINWQDNFKF
jgi:hypothetical protein